MVRIRLRRVGAKKQPSYRIVAADKESPRDGRFLEILGFYNPLTEPATLKIKEDKVYKWLSQGAQPSDSVKQLFQSAGVFERYERFKAGESLDTLMEEAMAAEESRTGSQKTRRPAPSQSVKKEKQPAAELEQEPEPEAESVE
jgi:small subunit ribosomal protein S16